MAVGFGDHFIIACHNKEMPIILMEREFGIRPLCNEPTLSIMSIFIDGFFGKRLYAMSPAARFDAKLSMHLCLFTIVQMYDVNIDKNKYFSTNIALIADADAKGYILAYNRLLFSMQKVAFHDARGRPLQRRTQPPETQQVKKQEKSAGR